MKFAQAFGASAVEWILFARQNGEKEVVLMFAARKIISRLTMAHKATLRRSGGSVVLVIPKAIARSLSVTVGSAVELSVDQGRLNVTPARRTLAERLALSPKRPADWPREDAQLLDRPVGRELI